MLPRNSTRKGREWVNAPGYSRLNSHVFVVSSYAIGMTLIFARGTPSCSSAACDHDELTTMRSARAHSSRQFVQYCDGGPFHIPRFNGSSAKSRETILSSGGPASIWPSTVRHPL